MTEEDRYEEDYRVLEQNRRKIEEQLRSAEQMVDELKYKMINIEAKMEYINYRRKTEESGALDGVDIPDDRVKEEPAD